MVATFEEWMAGASVFLNTDRQNKYAKRRGYNDNDRWVAVSGYDYSEELETAVYNLDFRGVEWIMACELIDDGLKAGTIWMGTGDLPSEAVANLEAKMREHKEKVIDPTTANL